MTTELEQGTTDNKTVTRCNFTPYGMAEAVEGHYVSFTDHERVVGELQSDIAMYQEGSERIGLKGIEMRNEIDNLRDEAAGLKKDAARWQFARQILSIEAIESASLEFRAFGLPSAEYENLRADNAIDAAMEKGNAS